MTTQINGGTIKYGRTIKTGDFENKRGDVELTFTIDEGHDIDATLDLVVETAHKTLASMLNYDTVAAPASAAKAAAPVAPPKAAAPKPAPAKAAPKMPAAKAAAPASAAEIEDPLEEKETSPPADDTGEDEGLDDLFGAAETEMREISDKEITDATQKCQMQNKNAPAVRKLLESLGVKTPPNRLIDLPQDKRQEYLTKLGEIKPLA